jgi:hypothetical protein
MKTTMHHSIEKLHRLVRARIIPLLTLTSLLGAAEPQHAQETTGIIAGRVYNVAIGAYANNARVTIEGTALETFTNQDGEYRFAQAPAGAHRVTVAHAGLASQTANVTVTPGGVSPQDFELTLPLRGVAGNVLQMEAYIVEAKEMGAQAIALNEQRHAPNIKNVVAFEEFGNISDGNIGEYLKYVPGVVVTYGPQTAESASVRGMPDTGTLVLLDGAEISSTDGDRTFSFASSAVGSVDRVEVTKVPTPDMPANAIGGTINIIGKSGFASKKRKTTVNVFATYSTLDGIAPPSTGREPGPDPATTKSRVLPGFDLAHVQPLNDKLAFTFNISGSTRRYDMS